MNDETKKPTDNNDVSTDSAPSGVTAASAIAELQKAAEKMFSDPMCNYLLLQKPNVLNIGITMN